MDVNKIRELAKEFNLMNVASGEIDITKESISNMDYLYNILFQEVQIRHQHRDERLREISKLPDKTFDHTNITKGLEWQLKKLSEFDLKVVK